MKNCIKFVWGTLLALLGVATGTSSGVFLAAASDLPDAGVTNGGADANDTHDGIATETQGRQDGDSEMYQKDIDEKITRIRPMATPLDQISRKVTEASHTSSFEVKYYSVGTREIKCTLSEKVEEMTTGASCTLPVDDPNMFTLDDTIRVVGVRAITKPDGTAYADDDTNVPDLVLCVCGVDSTTNQPTVYAVNGEPDSSGQPIWVPALEEGQTLIRMGKACGEVDVQTGRFNNLPTAETQYCQNFMIQVEQSTFDSIAKKEVDWNFSDLEKDGIYDMRLAMENSFLFGAKGKIMHTTKKGMLTWFTGGIWYMAGKDIEVGEWDEEKQEAVISDENLVDIAKDLFVGTGVGDKRKIMFCGSDFLASLSKIKSEKFRLKETVEKWNLKFKSWDTDFGEIWAIHHELFDMNGMSDCAFALDPNYLSKKTHVSWTRNVLDLKKAGVRNTNAIVIQEVSCLYLRYAKAHARLQLAAAPSEDTDTDGSSD